MSDPDLDLPADPIARAADALGDPAATFTVSPARLRGRVAIAGLLIVYGFVANYFWWTVGPARFEHIVLVILFGPPVTGLSMLRHVARARGLTVLAYPTGVLRVQGTEVESYPWDEIETVRIRAVAAEPRIERGGNGEVSAAWLAVEPPVLRVWDAGVTVVRTDGTEATFGPALGDYPDLAERVQRGTFAALWPDVWERYRAGEPLAFGPFLASWAGLQFGKLMLPWADVAEVAVSQKNLSVKRAKKWLPWAVVELGDVPNPHVFVGLIAAARRHAGVVEPAEDSDDAE